MDTTMELDDLKAALRIIDTRLDRQHTLQQHAWRQGRLDRAQANLRTMRWTQFARIGGGLALMPLALPVWLGHWPHPLPVACGLLLQLYAIALCISGAHTLWMIGGIDFAAPVLAIQQQLARLRTSYLRSSFWLGNAWWVLWAPMLGVIAAWQMPDWMPVSAWDEPRAGSFLLLNMGLGVIAIATVAAGMAAWRRRAPDSLHRFEDRSSPGIAKARAVLAELDAYGRD